MGIASRESGRESDRSVRKNLRGTEIMMSSGPTETAPIGEAGRSHSAETPNITEATFQQVRELIVHGKLAPGSRVLEAELAQRLEVSRTPVRAALHRLRQEGYVRGSVDGGSKVKLAVAPLTQEDAKELYDIVGHLEGLASKAAAQLEKQARASLVTRLGDLNAKLRELAAAARGDANVIFDLDINFHQAIVDTGAGPRLRALHSAIKPQTERYWRLYASSILDQLGLSVSEHALIIESIASGNADSAERAIQANWQNGAERLSRVIATLGERGSW
jgi:DNA-binding GntR family transcriptional regulator